MLPEEEALELVPRELLMRIAALRPHLERNGVIVPRHERNRHPSYRLRYWEADPRTGGRRHRSITLPSAAITQAIKWRVDEMKAMCKALAQDAKRRREAPELEARQERMERRAMRRACQDAAGGGCDRHRRVGREFDRAAQNPWDLFRYTVGRAYLLPGPKTGRPRRRRLVLPSGTGAVAGPATPKST